MPIPLIHHRGFHNWSRLENSPLDGRQETCAENGLLAFKRAAADPNAIGIEFDVELCKNESGGPELCIFHDENMQAIDSSEDKIADLKLSEISQRVSQTTKRRFFDGDQPMSSVPSFKEMMQALTNYTGTLSIELKRNVSDLGDYVKTLMENLQYLPKNAKLIFHSFSINMLKAVIEPIQKQLPNAKFAFNFCKWLPECLELDQPDHSGLDELTRLQSDHDLFAKIDYLYPDYELLKPNTSSREKILAISREHNKPLIPWNVNNKEDVQDLESINQSDSSLVPALITDDRRIMSS